jgi:hypothetical protein
MPACYYSTGQLEAGSSALKKPTKVTISAFIILAVAVSGVTGGLLWLSLPPWWCHGTLYFNDSGGSHGGFEMAAQWIVTLSIRGGIGVLVVAPDPNQLGNSALKKWIYTITGFEINFESCVMALNGRVLTLPLVENDTVWNQFDHQYTIATPNLDPEIFPGFLSHYYVELRLAPVYA